MKQFLLSILLMLSVFANAQTKPLFTLLEDGLHNTADPSKGYIVLEFPNKSQSDLYKEVLMYVNKRYVSPKDVLSTIENESITVNGASKNVVHRNKLHVFNMNYTINFEFKDNKIKIEAPTFKLTAFYQQSQTLWVSRNNDLFLNTNFGIYNEKGKLMSEMAKTDIETFFNKYIADVSSYINNKKDW